MSLDGYIATKDNDLSWLSVVEKEGEDYGYVAFNEQVDTYLVGRKTYEVVLNLTGGSFPQAEKHKCYVVTRQERAAENGVVFFNGELKALIQDLKSKQGKNIYCEGGLEIVFALLKEQLIDEVIVSVIPILLGDGIPLFKAGFKTQKLRLIEAESYDTGLTQLHYSMT